MWIKKVGTNLLKYMFWGLLSFLTYNIFMAIGILDFWDMDVLPFVSVQQFSVLVGVFLFCMVIWSAKEKNISGLNIMIKKYGYVVHFLLYLFSVVIWYKCKESPKILLIYALEIIVFNGLLKNEMLKIFNYNFLSDSSMMTNYKEKPIVGKENLTKSQKRALEQLMKILDKRMSSESFNIALIGSWGSGKTSVTETLISELQNREKNEKRYFILKLNILTFSGTKNIIEYVKKYFYCLFKKYSVMGFEGKENVEFLSALANMLNDSGTMSSALNVLFGRGETSFCDIENERQLFIERVQRLLAVSGRKNIIFVIDDVDRSDIEEQVFKLLSEFSSIDGLISVISLDKKHDINLRQVIEGENVAQEEREAINDKIYISIDKYVHVRVRIEENYHVEYEESIKHQIILENKGVVKKENCYINCNGEKNTVSLFSTIKDYPTTEIVGRNMYSSGNYNILTELFLCNLEMQDKGLGSYFEGIVLEYLYHSKELFPFINKMLITNPEEWNLELYRVNVMWTSSFGDERFDWIVRLQNNANQLFWMLCQLVTALEMIEVIENKIQNEILNIVDVYDYYMITKFPDGTRKWENRSEIPVIYSGVDELELFVLDEEEMKELNISIQEKQYKKAEVILVEKVKDVSNFYFVSAMLGEFMVYLRKIMNNFRTFKMQLREAELLDMNYLDYLIKEWKPTKNLLNNIENIKKETALLRNLNISYPSLNSYINTLLYTNYISEFDTRFCNDELKDSRLWIFHGKKRNIIVISSKENEKYKFQFLDCQGNVIENINEDEMQEIQKKASLIWNS